MMAVLAAAILMSLAVPAADARVPRARHYHVGGPITLDTNLVSKSGASAWAIDQYLQSRTTLPRLGAAFLAAEQKYGVNARFLLAAAMHESAWGRGVIARVKHNLFGYNAYDRDPFHYASTYATYAANINATAKFIRDFYLTPGGRWWGGQPTLRSMQQFWSSSHQWGVNVSRIATSIRLATIARRSIRAATPVVSGPLHGGDRASVRIAWAGGAIPRGVTFIATWVPVEPPSDAPALTSSPSVTSSAAVLDPTTLANVAPPSSSDASTLDAPDPMARETVDARRTRTSARSITLNVGVPDRPGSYALQVEMRDTDRRALPAAQRVRIPAVDVRVWDDRAVSVDLEPGLDGTGAIVRITNTGRETIPATPSQPSPNAAAPAHEAVRTIVTVTAIAGDAVQPAPVTLLATSLATDLPPDESISFNLPAITGSSTRATSWLSVSLSVLGDPAWLTASAIPSVSFSSAGLGAIDPARAAAQAASLMDDSPSPGASTTESSPGPTAAPTPTASPAPTAAPSATRAPTAAPSATRAPTAAPSATRAPTAAPSATPAPSSTPAPRKTKRRYSEHSHAIVYRGAWSDASSSGYAGGHVSWSRTSGSSATFTFNGSFVSWIGPKGPTRGIARVLVDGRAVARVDLGQSSFVARAVLFTHSFRTAGRHTLKIEVLATPGRPYVAIDELRIKP